MDVLLCIKSHYYYYYYHLHHFWSSPTKERSYCFSTICSYNIIECDQGGRRAKKKPHHPTYWRTTVVNINTAADAKLKQIYIYIVDTYHYNNYRNTTFKIKTTNCIIHLYIIYNIFIYINIIQWNTL